MILVHYGKAETTEWAIKLLRAGELVPERIVVVDHDPRPFNAAQEEFVVRPQVNSGYGAAVNIGLGIIQSLSASPEDIVVAMNNDVEVRPDTLTLLARQCEGADFVPSFMGVMVHEGRGAVSGGGRINRWSGRARLAAGTKEPIEYIHGAFIAAPFGVWRTVNGMPENYFLYWEDAALGRRAQRRHIPLRVLSEVHVDHDEHASSSGDTVKYYLVRNGAFFMAHELGIFWKVWWQAYNRFRWLYHRFFRKDLIVQQALTDALRGNLGRAQSL